MDTPRFQRRLRLPHLRPDGEATARRVCRAVKRFYRRLILLAQALPPDARPAMRSSGWTPSPT